MPASKTDDGTEKAANASSEPGSRLRQAREAQGLSLEELGNELRLGPAALEALEENRFEALGATVFAKGYLKQYGTRLGLDVRELAEMYDRASGKPQVEIAPSRGIELRDERPVGRWLVRTLLFAIVIGGVAYWWLQRPQGEPVVTAADDADIAVPTTAERAATEGAVAGRAREEPETPSPVPEAETDPVPEPQDTAPVPRSGSPQDLASEVAASEVADDLDPVLDADGVPIAVASAAEAAATDGPAIEVHFLGESWAEVTDEDGTRLYYDLGRPGTRVSFPADRNLTFSFGGGAPVELSVDGESVPVPGAGQRDVVRFSLDELIN